MRIFYVLNSRWPTIKAYGLQVAKTCQALSRDAQVTLVVPNRRRYPEQEDLDWRQIYGVPGSFKVVWLWSPDWVASGWVGKVLFALQQSIFALRVRWYLLGRSGIVYSRDLFTLAIGGLFRRRLFWEIHQWPSRVRWFHRFVLGRLRGAIVITNALKERLVTAGFPAERIIIAPDGVDLEAFTDLPDKAEARRLTRLPMDVPIVLYAGHMYAWKGVDTLARAAPSIDGIVVFVGGSSTDVASMKAKYRGTPNIMFIGHRPHSEVALFLRAADVVVLPNSKDNGISEHYTSPLKMFEYMASGTPIVASDLPSIREVLNEENALLVTPGDSYTMAEEIMDLLRDSQLGTRLASRAGQDVRQYSWEQRARHILELIKS